MLIIRLSYSCKGKVIRVFCQFLRKITCCIRQCTGEICQSLAFTLVLAVVHKVEQCVAAPSLFYCLSYIEESFCGFMTIPVHQVPVVSPWYGKKHFFQLSHNLWDRHRRFCHTLWHNCKILMIKQVELFAIINVANGKTCGVGIPTL